MKPQKMFDRYPVLTAILIILALLAGSSAQLSLPPSTQATQHQKPANRAGAADISDHSQSNRKTDRLDPLKQKNDALKRRAE